jgi:hypothetical protein
LPGGRVLRLIAVLRRRWPVVALFAVAFLALSDQHCGKLYHRDLDVPRGDGMYRPYVAVQDGHKIYLQVMSAGLDGDLDITDEVARFGYVGYQWKTSSGRPIYPHAIGPVMVWTPVFWLAHGASKLGNLFGADIPSHGFTLFHQRIVYFTSVIFAWLTALFGYRSARRLLGDTWAAPVAAIAVLFGTNLSYYAVQRPDYGHAMSALVSALLLAYWIATFGQTRWRRFVFVGALLGAAALVRSANLFFGVIVAIELATHVPAVARARDWRGLARLAGLGAISLGVALVVYTPQFLVWKYHYESGFFTPPHGDSYVHLGRPMLTEFFYSSHNGFFYTHPLAYFGLTGLLLLPRRHRVVGVALFVAVLVQAYVNSCVYDWWAMGSFGARRMCCTSLALIIGLASMARLGARGLRRLRVPAWPRRAIGVLALAWFVVWNQSYDDAARDRRTSKPLVMCCDELPGFMETLAQPIHDRIGNPFALPASWWFAHRWDVDLTQWDGAVTGTYAARPSHHDLTSKRDERKSYAWNIPGVNFEPWLARGFGPRQSYRDAERGGKRLYFRWTSAREGAVFVPLFLPGDHTMAVPVHANVALGDPPARVRIALNGRVVWDREIAFGWHVAEFRAPADLVERGTNLLAFIAADLAPGRAAPALPSQPSRAPSGIAVGQMKIWIVDPAR